MTSKLHHLVVSIATVLLVGCSTQPEECYEYVPAFVVQIDSVTITPREATLHVVCTSNCWQDVLGSYRVRYTTDTIDVVIHSKRVSGFCLPASSLYEAPLRIPVANGGTYTIALPSATEEPMDTTVVIPN